MANGKKMGIKDTEEESKFGQMEADMKDIGKKINRMVLEKKVGLTVLHMKESINKGKKVDKVNSNGLMVVHMKVNLRIII